MVIGPLAAAASGAGTRSPPPPQAASDRVTVDGGGERQDFQGASMHGGSPHSGRGDGVDGGRMGELGSASEAGRWTGRSAAGLRKLDVVGVAVGDELQQRAGRRAAPGHGVGRPRWSGSGKMWRAMSVAVEAGDREVLGRPQPLAVQRRRGRRWPSGRWRRRWRSVGDSRRAGAGSPTRPGSGGEVGVLDQVDGQPGLAHRRHERRPGGAGRAACRRPRRRRRCGGDPAPRRCVDGLPDAGLVVQVDRRERRRPVRAGPAVTAGRPSSVSRASRESSSRRSVRKTPSTRGSSSQRPVRAQLRVASSATTLSTSTWPSSASTDSTPGDERREERVGGEHRRVAADHQPEREAALGGQGAGTGPRSPAHLARRWPGCAPGSAARRRAVVEDEGDQALADPDPAGDVGDGRTSFRHAPAVRL